MSLEALDWVEDSSRADLGVSEGWVFQRKKDRVYLIQLECNHPVHIGRSRGIFTFANV